LKSEKLSSYQKLKSQPYRVTNAKVKKVPLPLLSPPSGSKGKRWLELKKKRGQTAVCCNLQRERGRYAKGESCSFCSFHLDIGIVGGTAALDSPAATPTPLGTSPRLPSEELGVAPR